MKPELDRAFTIAYPKLVKIAASLLRRRGQNPAEAAGLVNETYCLVVKQKYLQTENLVGTAVFLMKRVLARRAARALAAKRGAGALDVTLDETSGEAAVDTWMVVAVRRALSKLGRRLARVVALRLSGLAAWEIALVLGVSEATVKRDWHEARVRLAKDLLL